jgi:uracil phosphoribosyltransferase
MSPSAAVTDHTVPNKQYDVPPSVFTLRRTAQLEALYTIIRDKDTSRGDFIFYSDRIIRLLVEEGLNHLPVVPRVVETPTVRAPGIQRSVLTACRGRCTKGLALRERSAAYPYCARERCVLSPLHPQCHVTHYMNTQAMEQGLREVCRSVRIGKILIQRVRYAPHQHVALTWLFRMRRRPVPNSSTPRYVVFPSSFPIVPNIARTQLPQDIAQRYVLLLDPMLGMPLSYDPRLPTQRRDKQLLVGRL